MADTNVVVISGRIIRDPELKANANGMNYCRFSIANNKSKEETSFFNFSAFGKTAENVASYMKKGTYVNVIGRVDQQKYKNKDGVEQTIYSFIANTVDFAGGRRGDDAEQTPAPAKTVAKAPAKATPAPAPEEEEKPEVLPF